MKLKLAILMMTTILFTGCFKEDGQIRIKSDIENAIIYIDGDKKGMTGDGYTTIIIEEGDHKVRIYKEKNKEWYYEGTQDVFIGANSSVKVKIDTDKKATEYRIERLVQEKKEREIRLAKDKKERVNKKNIWNLKYSKYEVYADYENQLVWQNNNDVNNIRKQWVSTINYKAKNYMNTYGDTATTYCENLKFADFTDWRLPTRNELTDLYKRKIHLNGSSNYYWSSTTYPNYKYAALMIHASDGYEGSDPKKAIHSVRCVRDD